MKHCLALSIALFSSTAFASPSVETQLAPERGPRQRMLLTADGPGAGNHAFGAFVGLPVLNLELAYAYGITERLTYELELSIPATPLALGYNSTALRCTAIRAGGFALALRGGASAMVGLYPGDAPVVFASAFGGAMASAGTDDKRFTIGLAVPYSYDSDTDRWSHEVSVGGTL